MMVISLFSFGFYNGNNSNLGIVVLIAGLLFGWLVMPGGLAAYANIFYIIILIRFLIKKPFSSVLATSMLLLASLTVIFEGYDLGGGLQTVYAWGWGAVFWCISLITIAIATFKQDQDIAVKKQFLIILAVLSLTLIPIGVLRFYQSQNFNELVKERCLPEGAAFTVCKNSK